MADPLFWLGLSILLVAVSLVAVLIAALPAFRELARAARSAEKLFDTLSREMPPTLESIRMTSLEITDLKADVSEGVQGAGHVVQQLDQSITGVKKQAEQAQKTTRSFMAGFKAAWRSLRTPQSGSVRSAYLLEAPDRFDGSDNFDGDASDSPHLDSSHIETLPSTYHSSAPEIAERLEKAELDLLEISDPDLSESHVQRPTNRLS